MITKLFTVKKPFHLSYGHHIGAKSLGTSRELSVGEMLIYESSAPNGNQWFVDGFGERGSAHGFYSFSALLNKGYLSNV
jgi:hypothetical protein